MPSAERVLLDTHTLLWWQAQPDQARPERISETAWERITAASCVLVSPISCWEVGMLVGKERIQLDRPHRGMDPRHARHRRHRRRRADPADRGSGC